MKADSADSSPSEPAIAWRACGYLTITRTGQIVRMSEAVRQWTGSPSNGRPEAIELAELMGDQGAQELMAAIETVTLPQPGQCTEAIKSSTPLVFEAVLNRSAGPALPALFSLSAPPAQSGDDIEVAVLNLDGFRDSVRMPTRPGGANSLRHSLARVRQLTAIADATPDGILSINDEQTITFANPAAARMFRCPIDEMLGAPMERFIPQRYRRAHRLHVAEFGKSGVTTREMAGHLAIAGLRDDGSEFPLEASISQIRVGAQPIYTVILRDITIRRYAEEELEFTRSQLRLLTARQTQLRETEQQHVSRELHDDIGQRLSALKMDIATLKHLLPDNVPALFDTIEGMDELLSSTVAAVRALAIGLRPQVLDDLGLVPALETFLAEIQDRYDLKCILHADAALHVTEDDSVAVFRIVQEAVHNIAKHALANRVDVTLQAQDQHLTLTISDDGVGMDPDAQRKAGALGLLGMRERISSRNGEMDIHSVLGAGTTIKCRIPQD